ncbi:NINE protein [Microbacterium sp. BWR-S6Y]|uniref:NINE protein n=1 Tax=Microbacterium sp. BWR-S6Y TaxID=3232073 RepID=UPI0035276CC1
MGTSFEQFRALLTNPAARRSVGIDMSDAQARSIASDEALSRAHYDHWQRNYRPGVVVVPEAASSAALEPARVSPPPGWYPGQGGQMQWWDGAQWVQGAYAPTPVVMRARKESGIAYLLAILLGGFAAHRFYLGRVGSAIGFLCLWWIGWFTIGLVVGTFMVIAAGIWWILDLFFIPRMVREENARPYAA